MNIRAKHHRPGLTLLEVVVATAIFMMALVALWQLFVFGGERALDVKLQARTSLVCQSKLAELTAGAELPNSTGGYQGLTSEANDINKDLQWKMEVSSAGIENLYDVKIWVKAEIDGGRIFESHLCQLVLDPKVRGSTLDQPQTAVAGTPTEDATMPTDPNAPAGGNNQGGTNQGGANQGGANQGGGNQGGQKGGGNQGGQKGGGNQGGGKGGGIPGGGKGGNFGGQKGGGGPPGGGKGFGGQKGGGNPGGLPGGGKGGGNFGGQKGGGNPGGGPKLGPGNPPQLGPGNNNPAGQKGGGNPGGGKGGGGAFGGK